ncbi:arsenate reductase (glutaredoxin) [Neptunitalea lumnitzerae]|uniref:Arsenate reductase (Glutaredoxin) n=1 Tax=Neptunitalea lumnitzerae TaxID=2965509 RepID=A0ABQ5MIA3_9FLAO|nr:arsenate reductase (glutaredoxin) [Neptunitalea sp. Y10]GLB49144.1 arsenate reductase (glutaredoxin) [Neptunitalea sp. Y10]
MITIYHNARCGKSREGLKLVEESNQEFEIVKYLDTPPTETELKEILNKLGYKPSELIRTNEAIWKENYKGKTFTDDELITIMVENPKLIERPIVINGNKAVVGRPPEKIKDIL